MMIRRFFSAFACCVTAFSLHAQPFFEGTFEYKVEMTGADADQIKQNEPNNNLTMHMKDASYIVTLFGGRTPKNFMFVADSNYQYILQADQQRAFKYYPHADIDSTKKKEEKIPAVKTDKTATVLNEMCMVYEVKKADETTYYMVSDKYRINIDLYKDKTRANALFLVPGLEGRIPLKTIRKKETLTVTTTVSKITPRKFDISQFQIPAGFEVRKRYFGM